MSDIKTILDQLNVELSINESINLCEYYLSNNDGIIKASIILLKDSLTEIINDFENDNYDELEQKLLYIAKIQSELFVSCIKRDVSYSIKNIIASLSFINVVLILLDSMGVG